MESLRQMQTTSTLLAKKPANAFSANAGAGVIKSTAAAAAVVIATNNNNNNKNNSNNNSQASPLLNFSTVGGQQIRRCIFGCDELASICRFPVHDLKRCNNWLKFFNISAESIQAHGGLSNLRVCLRHFNESQQMAKTRIKTTPTRMQKDALMAAASGDMKTRLRTIEAKHANAVAISKTTTTLKPPTTTTTTTTTTIAALPKRTNSISSATSSISHASDTHSMQSENERETSAATLQLMTTKTPTATQIAVNSLPHKPKLTTLHNNALKNRKVYMITEKSEDAPNDLTTHTTSTSATVGQKRKMYLIMERGDSAPSHADNGTDAAALHATKQLKFENGGSGSAATKKLLLFADKSDGELTQNFEKILPEILQRIQTTQDAAAKHGVAANGSMPILAAMPAANARLPITLPPKKNRTKISTTNAMPPVAAQASSINHNNNNNGAVVGAIINGATACIMPQVQQTCAATPVIVSNASVITPTRNCNYNGQKSNGHALAEPQQKNINLSTDFLFLMKMLPKLESIPEPHKNHVKNCIEKIVTQNASIFEK